jgi:dihydropteroate synthase
MIEKGADIIDIGARATGPGSPPLSIGEETERVTAILQEVGGAGTISLDTMYPEVLEAALRYEIHTVNDISGLLNPRMGELIAEAGLPAILMSACKRPGDARTVKEVEEALSMVISRCAAAGIQDFILDPGIGLWTPERTVADNWDLCRRFSEFRQFKRPLLAAVSRKSFLGELLEKPVRERMAASLALNVLLISRGAAVLRTHDVEEMADAIRVYERMGEGA